MTVTFRTSEEVADVAAIVVGASMSIPDGFAQSMVVPVDISISGSKVSLCAMVQ